MRRLYAGVIAWFARIWTTKKGRVGTVLIPATVVLDNYGRLETVVKGIMALPPLIAIVHAWWFDPALILGGLGLIYLSSRETKGRVPPRTLPERVDDTEMRLNAVESRWKYAKIDELLPELVNRTTLLGGMGQRAARLNIWLSELTALISETDDATSDFERIKIAYPESAFAKTPFAKAWRPLVRTEPSDESVRLGLAWMHSLENHVNHCQSAASTWNIPVSTQEAAQALRAYISSQSSGVTGTECLSLLGRHREQLENVRKAEAASFGEPIQSFKQIL